MGDASHHVDAINELSELAVRPDWVAEDPEEHLLPHLKRGAEAVGLTVTSFATAPDGAFTVHVKGAGGMSRSQLRQAAWSTLGAAVEMTTYVREIKDDGGVTFEVVTGMPVDAGPFATHGHSIRLVIDAA